MKRELLGLNKRYQPWNLDPLPDSCSSSSRCGPGAASEQLQRNGKDDEKRQKNFRREMRLRNTPANEGGGERKEKASSTSVFSPMSIIYVVWAFFNMIIYLFTFFSGACLWNFFKRRPLARSLFFSLFLLYTSMKSKATCIVDPSRMCKSSSNIWVLCISSRRRCAKLKLNQKGALLHLTMTCGRKWEHFVFTFSATWLLWWRTKKKLSSFIWSKSLFYFLNRRISTWCCFCTGRTNKSKVFAPQFAKLQLIY